MNKADEISNAEIRKELLKGLLSIWYPNKCNYEDDNNVGGEDE